MVPTFPDGGRCRMTSNDQADSSSPRPRPTAGRVPDDLPVDSDVDPFRPSSRRKRDSGLPAHHHPGLIVLVFIGGSFGAVSRYGLSHFLGSPDGFPIATLAENVGGAFLLGVLLEALSRRGPDHGRRRQLRLLLGTGFLGGFTTYSSFAVDTVHLLGDGETFRAIIYLALTILLGATASFAGIWSAATQHHDRQDRRDRGKHQEPDQEPALMPVDRSGDSGRAAASGTSTDARGPGDPSDSAARRNS